MTKNWTFDWGESHSMLSAECWVSTHLIDRDVPGCFATEVFQIVDARHVGFYFNDDEIDDLAEYGRKYLEPAYSRDFFERSLEARLDFRKHFKRVCAVDLREASDSYLGALFNVYWRVYRRITAFFNASIGFYLEAAEKELKSILLNEAGDELLMQEMFSALTLPSKLDIIKLEELDIARFREAAAVSDDMLLAHAEKHPWYFFNTYHSDDAVAFLRQRIATEGPGFEELKTRYEEESAHILTKQRELILTIHKGQRAGELADLLRSFGHDRLELKAVWSGAEFLFRDLLNEIAKRLRLSVEDLLWAFRGSEIASALEGLAPLPTNELATRKDFYLFTLAGGKLEFLSGEPARSRAREEIGYGEKSTALEARGVVAHPGVARGDARLVFLRDLKQLMSDLESFQTGEIMVTQMTQPTMVSMARKASAIVTDEGGITSHAAIIARELNIPCLVGCKIATKIFRTGDRIIVDTETAVCRREERTV